MTATLDQHARHIDLARSRFLKAKDAFTKASVDVLAGRPGAAESVNAALAELDAARADLSRLQDVQPTAYALGRVLTDVDIARI